MRYVSKSADALRGHQFFFIEVFFIAVLMFFTALPASAQRTIHLLVTDAADDVSNPGSLRAQIRNVENNFNNCAGDTCNNFEIRFALPEPPIIFLNEPLDVSARTNRTVKINGENKVTIDGQHQTMIFEVGRRSGTVEFSGLKLINGGGGFPAVLVSSRISTVIIDKSTISHSQAADSGGGIQNAGIMTIRNSTIAENSPGGIAYDGLNDSRMTITNSTIAGNIAGAGITHTGTADMTITNSTIASNRGGVIVQDAGAMQINDTILADNGTNCSSSITGRLFHNRQNISDDDSCGFQNQIGAHGRELGDNIDPRLDPAGLQDNGGPTETIALRFTSPAMDAIQCTPLLGVDQRGSPRPAPPPRRFDRCDIGAFELQSGGIVNDLFTHEQPKLSPTNDPNVFSIEATFKYALRFGNPSPTIIEPFFQVIELVSVSGAGALLLNADGGPGGIGATLHPPDAPVLLPGDEFTVTFNIRLEKREKFTLRVNLLGEVIL